MDLFVGTSGYSYKEWKGTFYPDDLPANKMLSFYAGQFSTVEINNSFYRMPDAKTVARWGSEVPDGFTFVLKAPQRITHQKKLVDCGDDVHHLFEVAEALGPKLGPVLFQLPPFQRKDTERLRNFINVLPRQQPVAFEFRHESWVDDEVMSILRERDAAMCLSDTDDVSDPDKLIVPAASWGYMRLRRTEYTDADLDAWRRRIDAAQWQRAFIFFKHEDEGKGPIFAKRFLAIQPD
ncbi:MAG TPA: DUF72 domain-containing protein [Thermoanaerobaculia bacterium]|nr:DUF72 domain-containing protein [Thermoanaerobaculia bacterium]